MKFQPKTEQEIVEANLLPVGVYDFEVANATDEVSRSGNDMIKLTLNIFDHEGNQRLLYDYLLESMAFKLRHAAEACAMLDKYESGELHSGDFLGRTGKLKVGIKKDKTGQYPDQNGVVDYIPKEEVETKKSAPADLNDEIPF